MSWTDELKKEKYHGPQTKYGGYASQSINIHLKDLNHHLEQLEQKFKVNPNSWEDKEIETYIENMRRIMDKMDEKLVNEAKYGNALTGRADEKWLGNYSAKRNSPHVENREKPSVE